MCAFSRIDCRMASDQVPSTFGHEIGKNCSWSWRRWSEREWLKKASLWSGFSHWKTTVDLSAADGDGSVCRHTFHLPFGTNFKLRLNAIRTLCSTVQCSQTGDFYLLNFELLMWKTSYLYPTELLRTFASLIFPLLIIIIDRKPIFKLRRIHLWGHFDHSAFRLGFTLHFAYWQMFFFFFSIFHSKSAQFMESNTSFEWIFLLTFDQWETPIPITSKI